MLGGAVACREAPRPDTAAAAALDDCRRIAAAQMLYREQTGAGHAAPLACLVDPSACVPSYSGAAFLDVDLAAPERAGYYRRFHPGPAIDPAEAARRGIARVHVTTWAYTARPAAGVSERHFCVDSTGRLCAAPRPLDVAGPQCPAPPGCTALP